MTPMEAHVIGFQLWVKAVQKAGSTEYEKVSRHCRAGSAEPDRRHGQAAAQSHITKPVYIGEVRDDGQFDVVWKTKEEVPGEAWSHYCRRQEHHRRLGDRSSAATTTAPPRCSGQNYK